MGNQRHLGLTHPGGTATPLPQATLSRRRWLQGAVAAPWVGALSGCDWWFGKGDDADTSYQATIADGRVAIREAMARVDAPSVSVALQDNGVIVWEEAFGVTDRSTGAAATVDTLYNIGSCSKVVVTTAVMILVDRGLVALDVPITRYLPEFRMADPRYAQITVRMLLNHSSGLPGTNVRNIFTFRAVPGYEAQTEAALASLDLKAPPGEFSVYCNDGFTLAQRVVAVVSGQPYPEFVRREILDPLGMRLSRFPLEPLPEGSFGHAYIGEERQGQEYVQAWGTGGLISTPREMMRLASMFLNEGTLDGARVLSPESVRAMAQNQTAEQSWYPFSQLQFGLGWDTVAAPGLQVEGLRCWEKNGGTAFYGSDFFVMPDEKLAVMITGASTAYGAGALAERILLHALVERGTLASMPARLTRSSAQPQPASSEEVAAITGIYGSHAAMYRVSAHGNNGIDVAQWLGGQWQTVASNWQRDTDGFFVDPDDTTSGYRRQDVEGTVFLMHRFRVNYGHYLLAFPQAQRLAPAPALPAAWQNRLGRQWLVVNEDWSSVILELGGAGMQLGSLPDLPGWILIDDNQPVLPDGNDRTRMALTIPVNFGRDLMQLQVQRVEGEEWLDVNGQRFRPRESVAELPAGVQVVGINSRGETAWRRVPAGARLTLRGSQAAWKLYDDNLELLADGEGDGEATASAGVGWLGIWGEAGTAASVTVSL